MKYGTMLGDNTENMLNYKLSRKAENDLLDIALYGDEKYGEAESDKYREKLKKQFLILAESPLRYPAVDHIRVGYRRSVCGVHSIYYKIDNSGIVEIMRVLRSQNTEEL